MNEFLCKLRVADSSDTAVEGHTLSLSQLRFLLQLLESRGQVIHQTLPVSVVGRGNDNADSLRVHHLLESPTSLVHVVGDSKGVIGSRLEAHSEWG